MQRLATNSGTVTALAIVAGAVGLSAWQNVVYISSLGHTLEDTSVWIGLALLSGAVKLRIPFTANWLRSPVLVCAFGVALAFDIMCAVGHGAMTRGSKLEAYEATRAKHHALQGEVTRLENELARVPVHEQTGRNSDAIRVQLASLKASTGCVRDETRGNCPIVLASVKTELANAEAAERRADDDGQRRAVLDAELSAARAALKGHEVPAHPDPQAAFLASTLGIPERFAASWQTVLGVLILELAVIAGAIMADKARTSSTSPAPAPPAPKAPKPRAAPKGAGPDAALATLHDVAKGASCAGLTVQGRTISGTQRAYALAFGCSPPTATRWLKALDARGVLQMNASASGRETKVTLN